jgi:predicted nucleotidyltransferase
MFGVVNPVSESTRLRWWSQTAVARVIVAVKLRQGYEGSPVVSPELGHIDHDTEQAVRRFLALIASRYDMAGAIVYGSRARGTYRPDSDADVAILLNGEHQRVLTTTLAMADLAYDVLLETGVNISPLPVWLDEWQHPETHSNPTLLHNIAREGVRL